MPLPTPDYYTKLLEFRSKDNVKLKKCRYIKDTVDFRNYQAIGVLHLITAKRFLLGDAAGLGKTLQSLACYGYLKETYPDLKLLVISPKSALYQWKGEVEKFMHGVTAEVVASGNIRIGKGPANLLTGETARKYKLDQFFSNNTDILIINYNTLVSEHEQLIPRLGRYMVIFDEATYFKNYRNETWRAVNRTATKASRVIALTATVIKNRLEEAFSIFFAVIPGLFTNVTRFRNAFHNTLILKMGTYTDKKTNTVKDRRVPKLIGYKNLNVFRKYIDPYFLGRKKEDVAKELPKLISKEVVLQMEDRQDKAYRDALEGILVLDSGETKELEKISRLIFCQQISDSPNLIGIDAPSSKEQELIQLLKEDFIDEKVIVFTNFKKQIDRFEKIFKKEKIPMTRITGDENAAKREVNKQNFQNKESKVDVIFINRAGSESINLQAASTFIFYDLPWSYGDYIQLVGRAQRIGSEHTSILVLHFINKGTIDEHVLKVLKSKQGLVTEIFGATKSGELNFDPDIVEYLFTELVNDANREKNEG